jgi:HEAT repeat protein
MAGAADVAEARALWRDPSADVHRRCLAARAIGLLGEYDASWLAEGMKDDGSPLERARWRGMMDAQRRRDPEGREGTAEKMRQLGAGSIAEVMAILQDSSAASDRRIAAADVLGGFRQRDAVDALIETLAEGEVNLSWACMRALVDIGSLRGSRRLIGIARGKYPLPARQEAIYTLWQLEEARAEPLFIHLSGAVETEEEYVRDMATEALGNTCFRPRTERALAERLFDPSPSIRYAALCACSLMNPRCGSSHVFRGIIRRALIAKLDDPDQVDDDRVIADFAARLLGPSSCSV